MSITHTPHSFFVDNLTCGISDLIELAESHLLSGRYESACSCLKEALLMGEQDLRVYNRLGYVNYCQHKYHTSLECYQMALDLDADDPEVVNNLGLLYFAIAEYRVAEKYFLKAVNFPETRAKAYANLAKLALISKNYKQGWNYFWCKLNSNDAEFSSPGKLKDKSILICGDVDHWQEMFYLRFIPEFMEFEPKNISYYASEELQCLFRSGFEGVELLRSLPMKTQYDVILSIVELPGVLGEIKEFSIIESIPFSPPVKSKIKIIRNLLPHNGRKNIAVVWESTNPESNDSIMRISPELLGESLRYYDANILVLQKKASDRDIQLLEKGLRRKVFNYGFVNESVADVLAFLSEIDHYISVGDQNIHLASSLEKKISVFVTHPPQWQWLIEGDKSPWFPNIKIHRQDVSGSWEQACQDLKLSLHE